MVHNSLEGLAWGEKRWGIIPPRLLTHPHLTLQTSPFIYSGWPHMKHAFSLPLQGEGEVHSWSACPHCAGASWGTWVCCVSDSSSAERVPTRQSLPPSLPASALHVPERNLWLEGHVQIENSDSSELQARMMWCLAPFSFHHWLCLTLWGTLCLWSLNLQSQVPSWKTPSSTKL